MRFQFFKKNPERIRKETRKGYPRCIDAVRE